MRIQIKRDTTENWISNNPVLLSGEFGYDTTQKLIKIGDGATPWNTLPYCNYDQFVNECKSYTNTKVADLVGSAPTTLDTLAELAAAIQDHKSVTDALDAAIGNKANSSDLSNHINNKSNPHSVTKAQIGLENVENKSSATIRGELTKDNVTNALGYTPPTTNTTYGVATSSTLGLIKSGTDITVDSNGNVSINDDSHNHTIANIDNLQSTLDGKLDKTSFEYNKELILGSSGKVCIGKFPCYDTNISVEIKSTTNTTYNGTLIIATQNINESLGGVYKAVVYGDENNTLTDSIKIEYLSGSRVFSVYIDLPSWSKNLLHIQCAALWGTPTDIATIVDSIPSTATIVPTNALNDSYYKKNEIDTKLGTQVTYTLSGSVLNINTK